MSSAPREFEVWAMKENGEFETMLVSGSYDAHDPSGKNIQTFEIKQTGRIVKRIQLRVKSNHGHEKYTCLYR